VEYLSKYFEITLFFYNPNISDKEEYDKRAAELLRLVSEMEKKGVFEKGRVRAQIMPFDSSAFFAMAKGLEDVPERGERCRKCYELRMSEAAAAAAKGGYDYFTTTLSISPLKNAEWIYEIGQAIAVEYNVAHLPSDFKKRGGYQRSIELSREYGLYRQDFCGCVYSRLQRQAATAGTRGCPAK